MLLNTAASQGCADWLREGESEAGLLEPGILSEAFSPQQVVHEIRNYPYPQLHFLALQGLNASRHTSAVRDSYEVRPAPLSGDPPVSLAPAGLVEMPLSPLPPLRVGRAWVVGVASGLRVGERRRE